MNLNKVFLLGRLTADPQLRTTASGQNVATFSIATNRVWTGPAGKREDVQFHNIVVWGRQADIAQRFLAKGGLVLVEGRIQTRSWDDKQGQKRKTTEIVADYLQLGPRPMGAHANPDSFARGAGTPPESERLSGSPEIPTITLEEPPADAFADGAISSSSEPAEGEIKPEDLNF